MTPPPVAATGRLGRHGAAVAVSVAGALTALDLTIVTVALPELARDLDVGLGGLQWVVNGYTLAFASLILTAGALADRRGDRPVFTTGVALFTIFSAVCAAAPSATVLVVARALQGVGAAAILATSISLLARTYAGAARAAAIAAWVTAGTLAANLGPVVGGLLVDAAGWRGIFLINVPVGVALLALLPVLVRRTAPGDGPRRPLDLPGVLLAVVGLFGLNAAVLAATDAGWTAPLGRGERRRRDPGAGRLRAAGSGSSKHTCAATTSDRCAAPTLARSPDAWHAVARTPPSSPETLARSGC